MDIAKSGRYLWLMGISPLFSAYIGLNAWFLSPRSSGKTKKALPFPVLTERAVAAVQLHDLP
jgi:hypothetical protein